MVTKMLCSIISNFVYASKLELFLIYFVNIAAKKYSILIFSGFTVLFMPFKALEIKFVFLL